MIDVSQAVSYIENKIEHGLHWPLYGDVRYDNVERCPRLDVRRLVQERFGTQIDVFGVEPAPATSVIQSAIEECQRVLK